MSNTDTDSSPRKGACTPTTAAIVIAIVGAAILVVLVVISAKVLTETRNNANASIRYSYTNPAPYSSPRTSSSAFNDWLSNVPSKRSNGEAPATYYQYYFFNITNLDAVVNNSAKGLATEAPVYPAVDEIGPYTYRYFVDRLDPTFDTDDERVTYKEYSRYIFDPSLSKMGSRQLDDQADIFTTVSSVYSSLFGNPLNTTLFGNPELIGRIGLSSVIGFSHIDWLNSIEASSANGSLFDPTEARFAALGCPGADSVSAAKCTRALNIWQHLYGPAFRGNNSNTAAVFSRLGAQLFGVSNNRWASAVPVEYWWYIDTFGTPDQKIGSPLQALALYNGTLMTSPALPQCNFAFGAVGAADCWYLNSLIITTLFPPEVGLSLAQVNGIKSYYQYLAFNYWNFVFASNGHLGAQYKSLFSPSNCGVQTGQYISPLAKGENGCNTFNNANMYIKATPRSLLFEQYNTIGPLLFPGRRTPFSFSSNYTSELDARQDSWQYTVGTGIKHAQDIDNLYVWKNKSSIPAGPANFWCHQPSDSTVAPSGFYPVQQLNLTGLTYATATQSQMTKFTPSFPAGQATGTDPSTFQKSVVGNKSVAIDLFVGDLARRTKMTYHRDASIKGVSVQRYKIDDSEFSAGLGFFGQYFAGLTNYSCPAATAGGFNAFTCYPRYGKLDQTALRNAVGAGFTPPSLAAPGSVLYTTGIDVCTISNPSNDDFLANSQLGADFASANELISMVDVEPYSGATLSSTFKQQMNILVQPYIGANLNIYTNINGSLFRSAAPNAHLHRATLIPVYWSNKVTILSDKQAESFQPKTVDNAVQKEEATDAARPVLIVGVVVGGLMIVFALGFVIVKSRAGYSSQNSKADVAV